MVVSTAHHVAILKSLLMIKLLQSSSKLTEVDRFSVKYTTQKIFILFIIYLRAKLYIFLPLLFKSIQLFYWLHQHQQQPSSFWNDLCYLMVTRTIIFSNTNLNHFLLTNFKEFKRIHYFLLYNAPQPFQVSVLNVNLFTLENDVFDIFALGELNTHWQCSSIPSFLLPHRHFQRFHDYFLGCW